MTEIVGPAELVLTASIARRYYLDGRSKVEIADEFKLSRFKVARMLDNALSSGMVRIEIGYPGVVNVAASSELREALHLEHSLVIDLSDDFAASVRRQVGTAAAELLTEIVSAHDVLGLAWSRSLLDMRAAITRLAPCEVVQLTGALSRPDVDDSSIELVRDVAKVGNGKAFYFYAPMIVADPATAAVLLKQPEVARAIDCFPSVTKAVVGVGGWDPPNSTVHDAIAPAERMILRRLGVFADVSGVLLNASGEAVHTPLTERIIGIKAEQLRQIPEVIAIAYGLEKAPATLAAIKGGYVHSLVTHTSFARALMVNA